MQNISTILNTSSVDTVQMVSYPLRYVTDVKRTDGECKWRKDDA